MPFPFFAACISDLVPVCFAFAIGGVRMCICARGAEIRKMTKKMRDENSLKINIQLTNFAVFLKKMRDGNLPEHGCFFFAFHSENHENKSV